MTLRQFKAMVEAIEFMAGDNDKEQQAKSLSGEKAFALAKRMFPRRKV